MEWKQRMMVTITAERGERNSGKDQGRINRFPRDKQTTNNRL